VNFRYIVRWPRSFGLCHPNLIRSIYFILFLKGKLQMMAQKWCGEAGHSRYGSRNQKRPLADCRQTNGRNFQEMRGRLDVMSATRL